MRRAKTLDGADVNSADVKRLLDIFNSLLLLSLSLALSSKLSIGILSEQFIYRLIIASASNSDSESNELKYLLAHIITKTRSCNIMQFFTAVKMIILR